jgi:hypothetical protein
MSSNDEIGHIRWGDGGGEECGVSVASCKIWVEWAPLGRVALLLTLRVVNTSEK